MKKLISYALTICMLITMLSSLTFSVSADSTTVYFDAVYPSGFSSKATSATYENGATGAFTNWTTGQKAAYITPTSYENVPVNEDIGITTPFLAMSWNSKYTMTIPEFALTEANKDNVLAFEYDAVSTYSGGLMSSATGASANRTSETRHEFYLGDGTNYAFGIGYQTTNTDKTLRYASNAKASSSNTISIEDNVWSHFAVKVYWSDADSKFKIRLTKDGEQIFDDVITSCTSITTFTMDPHTSSRYVYGGTFNGLGAQIQYGCYMGITNLVAYKYPVGTDVTSGNLIAKLREYNKNHANTASAKALAKNPTLQVAAEYEEAYATAFATATAAYNTFVAAPSVENSTAASTALAALNSAEAACEAYTSDEEPEAPPVETVGTVLTFDKLHTVATDASVTATAGNNTTFADTTEDPLVENAFYMAKQGGMSVAIPEQALDFATQGPNAKLVVEFDARINMSNAGNIETDTVNIALGGDNAKVSYTTPVDDTGASLGNQRYVSSVTANALMQFKYGNNIALNNEDSIFGDNAATYTEDEWHRYKLVYNLTDEDSVLGTYDLYVDNVKVASAPFFTTDNSIKKLVIYAVMNNRYGKGATDQLNKYDGTSTFGIANLSVVKYADNYDEGANTSKLATYIREKGESNYTLYNEELTKSILGETLVDEYNGAYTETIYLLTESFKTATKAKVDDLIDTMEQTSSTAQDILESLYKSYPTQVGQQALKTFNEIGTYEPQYVGKNGGKTVANQYGQAATNYVYGMQAADLMYHRKGTSESFLVLDGEKEAVEGIVLYKGDSSAISSGWIDSDNRNSWNYEREGKNATLVVEYDIKFLTYLKDVRPCRVRIYDQDACKVSGVYGPVDKDFGDWIDVENGVWYRFRHEIHVTDENGEFDPYVDTYCDGVLVGNHEPYSSTEYGKFPNPDSVAFNCVKQTDITGMSYMYNNVLMYKACDVTRPDSTVANVKVPVNDGALVSAIRKYQRYVDITGTTELDVALQYAIAACDNASKTQASVDTALAKLLTSVDQLPDDEIKPYFLETFKYMNASTNKQEYEAIGGSNVAGVYVTKKAKYSEDAKLFVVLYDNGDVMETSIVTVPATIAVGETQVIDLVDKITLPAYEEGHDYEIKAYMWNDTKGYKPVAESLTEKMYDPNRKIGIYIAGASITADYALTQYPMAGWGQMIKYYFKDWFYISTGAEDEVSTKNTLVEGLTEDTAQVKIVNTALGGRSTKSFILQGHLDAIMEHIQPGDYLFVSFLHNDQKKTAHQFTDPYTTNYDWCYEYIKAARSVGAIPIINVSCPRGEFSGSAGIGYYGPANMNAWPDSLRSVADKYGAMCSDSYVKWVDMFNEALDGKTSSAYTATKDNLLNKYHRFVNADGTVVVDGTTYSYDQTLWAGSRDYNRNLSDVTHMHVYGADQLAFFVVQDLKEKFPTSTIVRNLVDTDEKYVGLEEAFTFNEKCWTATDEAFEDENIK